MRSRSNYKGVSYAKSREAKGTRGGKGTPWVARLTLNGITRLGGYYATEAEAAQAYNDLFLAMVPDMLNKVENET